METGVRKKGPLTANRQRMGDGGVTMRKSEPPGAEGTQVEAGDPLEGQGCGCG